MCMQKDFGKDDLFVDFLSSITTNKSAPKPQNSLIVFHENRNAPPEIMPPNCACYILRIVYYVP